MKIVNTGNIFRIYTDDLKTYDKIPVGVYNVSFSKMTGFCLEKSANIAVKEKIYGAHEAKVDKILNTFKTIERNLGVILSGDKGIGKSICAKLLAQKAVKAKIPVILVNTYIPGIASFISSINQEVVVIFDEYDKTFAECDDSNPQVELLTLFDGLDQGKKLFVITCNEIRKLNEYIVNRPGRFHYHLRFNYPSAEEIREYLEDKISKEYYPEISKVIAFATKVNLNYDCLRSIAFELNLGYSFEDAILDLNIVNVEKEQYSAVIVFSDGVKVKERDLYLDLFDDSEESFWAYYDSKFEFWISFNPGDAEYSAISGDSIIPSDKIKFDWRFDESDFTKEEVARVNKLKPDHIVLKRKYSKALHYLV